MSNLIALASGALFALGLVVSGMTEPAKVQGFLDVFGNWDPSLALVMGGAVATNLFLFRRILKRPRPLANLTFDLPRATLIDRKLVLGSALFGVGWGLVGYCPGPALTALGTFNSDAFLFVFAMLAGVLLHWGGQRFVRRGAYQH